MKMYLDLNTRKPNWYGDVLRILESHGIKGSQAEASARDIALYIERIVSIYTNAIESALDKLERDIKELIARTTRELASLGVPIRQRLL